MLRSLGLAFLLVLQGACSVWDPLSPVAGAPSLEFRSWFDRSASEIPVPLPTSAPGEIHVTGDLWTPMGGYTLSAEAGSESRGLLLVVRAEQTTGGITIPIRHRYRARLMDLPPGRYRLRVVHRWGDQQSETVLRAVVRVP